MRNQIKGFTLIETMLVLVIISAVLYMAIGYFQQKTMQTRIDRTSVQMQQILNAALSYYVVNSKWPVTPGAAPIDLTATPSTNNLQLASAPYLPSGMQIASPWGAEHYYMYSDASGLKFTVYTKIVGGASGVGGASTAASAANMIAGTLPLASTTATAGSPPPVGTTPVCVPTDTTCYVASSIGIPGQNLNNAGSVNFAGVYHQGACVPVPTCPTDTKGTPLTPQVQVVPVSVTGLGDTTPGNAYPIVSFTAYVTGPATQPAQPPACDGSTTAPACNVSNVGALPASNAYWRACLQIWTEKGNVQQPGNDKWGEYVTVMAITRCAIPNEPSGSSYTAPIYSN